MATLELLLLLHCFLGLLLLLVLALLLASGLCSSLSACLAAKGENTIAETGRCAEGDSGLAAEMPLPLSAR